LGTKLSFGNSYTYPKFALLDPKYTYTVGEKTTIETAIDTFSHLFEGYLSVKSNPITDIIALEGLKKFGEILPYLLKRQFTSDVREKLMYLSLLGGFVLSQTGVTVVHAMGYAYTYHHHTAHGAANGFLMNTYIGYLESIEPGKLAMAMSTIGLARNELKLALDDLLGLPPIIEADILEQYTQETLINQKSVENTLGGLTSKEILNLWQIQSKIN
jgi:alcohol dehydrogenase class IV